METCKKRTKIVATIGPASESKEVLVKMFQAGVNMIRVNFSHAEEDEVAMRVKMVRDINEEYGFNVALLADLQGPKLRVGVVKEGVMLAPGDMLTFTNEKIEGDAQRVYMSYSKFAQDVKVGERILVDDGKLIFEVTETNLKDEVKAKVIQGGPLKSKKGVNLPNTEVSLPALTEKDINDAKVAMKYDFDWFALSFVRHQKDVQDLRDLMKDNGGYDIPIIAKIEKPEAIEKIDEIIAAVDGIMVARGDLGIETPMETVPLVQKEIVIKCKVANKPVIIATQMMESMLDSLTSTRAEVSDVANAVLDGADAVMLSAETSVGDYPVEVIETMAKIAKSVENSDIVRKVDHLPVDINVKTFITDIISHNAATVVKNMGGRAKAIVSLTTTGYTAYHLSSQRPNADIIVFTDNKKIVPALSLLWGVQAYYYTGTKNTDETIAEVNAIVKDKGYAKAGDYIINLNAMPYVEKGMTNTLRITEIK